MNPTNFRASILPRLSTGDQTLWTEFPIAVSKNKPGDPAKTHKKFLQLQTRDYTRTHVAGYDFVLVAPVAVDNVDPPYVDRNNALGIDVDREYSKMIDTICRAYSSRWP